MSPAVRVGALAVAAGGWLTAAILLWTSSVEPGATEVAGPKRRAVS